MKSKIFNKNELLFHFLPSPFPKNKIQDDVLNHKELILLEKGEEPEITNQSNKKPKYSNCFVIEEELEKTKGHNGKKGQQNTKGPCKSHNKPNIWRKNELENNSGGFFDEFKGKTDEKQVSQFKRNLINSHSHESSISIINSILIDYLSKDVYRNTINGSNGNTNTDTNIAEKINQNNKTSNSSDIIGNSVKTTTISADNFFDNADSILANTSDNTTNIVSCEQITYQNKNERPNLEKNVRSNAKPVNEEFNIKNIYKVNEFLQYPKDEPLWYIFHPTAKSSFGPITSINIEEMFNGKMLSEKSEIRFIDIYNLRNKKPFTFFAVKEISNQEFINDIDISSLLRLAVNIRSRDLKQKPNEIQIDGNCSEIIHPTHHSINTNSQSYESSKSNINSEKKTAINVLKKEEREELNQLKNVKKENAIDTAQEIYSSESIYNMASHKSKENNQGVYVIKEGNYPSDKKMVKKTKNKPVESDIKLGK